jgi:hypothetical protein
MTQGTSDDTVVPSLQEEAWKPSLLLPLLALVLPVIVAVLILQAVGPGEGPLAGEELARLKSGLSAQAYLPGRIAIAAVLAIHFCLCLGAITLTLDNLLGHSPPPARHATWLCGVGLALATAVIVAVFCSSGPLAAYSLTFGWLFVFFGSVPMEGGLRAMIWIPVTMGTVALALIAAAANADLGWRADPPNVRNQAYETRLLGVNSRLKQYLYILSIGLVACTVAVSLFLSLPAKVAQGDLWPGRTLLEEKAAQERAPPPPTTEASAEVIDVAKLKPRIELVELAAKEQAHQQAELAVYRAKVEAFANEMSVFWGAVFAMTLVAAIGIPIMRLQRRTQHYLDSLGESEAATKRLNEAGLLGHGLDKLKLFAALLAPLATGSLAGFVQAAIP